MLGKTVVIVTAMTLCSGGFASAQSSTATVPAKGSTGPTVPDTRPVDHGQLNTLTGVPHQYVDRQLRRTLGPGCGTH